MKIQPSASWLRAHWFVPMAAAIALCDLSVVRGGVHHATPMLQQQPQLTEWALLFDLALVIPALYLVCYRRDGRRALPRALALLCLGVWAASQILPADEQSLLPWLTPLRYLGAAALVLIEAKALMAVARAALRGADRATLEARLLQDTRMPPWVAKWAALEASLWARLLRWLRIGRRGD